MLLERLRHRHHHRVATEVVDRLHGEADLAERAGCSRFWMSNLVLPPYQLLVMQLPIFLPLFMFIFGSIKALKQTKK